MKSIVPIYKEDLKKVFRYDAEKNVLWRELKSGRMRVFNTSVANTENGYVTVSFIDRMIYVHRVIYTLVNDNIPEGMTIDHIDNVKNNNNINNLQILSNRENVLKSSGGINPIYYKDRNSYRVQVVIRFGEKGEKMKNFHFKYFKRKEEAQKLCDAYNAQFGQGKPLYKARESTLEHWTSCLQEFKDWYFNTKGG